jgi:hypothetical protein
MLRVQRVWTFRKGLYNQKVPVSNAGGKGGAKKKVGTNPQKREIRAQYDARTSRRKTKEILGRKQRPPSFLL